MPGPLFSDKLREIGRDAIAEADQSRLNFRQRSFGIGPNEEFELDKERLGPAEFAIKYGRNAQLERTWNPNRYRDDPLSVEQQRAREKTTSEWWNDSSRQVGAGVVSGVGGLVNLGVMIGEAQQKANTLPARLLGIETPEVDTRPIKKFVAETASGISNELLKGQTTAAKDKIDLAQREKAPLQRDAALSYENSNKDLKAWFRRIGQDALIEWDNMKANPGAKDKVVTEAVGSLIPSLLTSGGIGAAARAVTSRLMLGKTATNLIEKGSVALSIGAMEGQGAYNQTVVQVGQMSERELMDGSPEYRELRANGASHEEAQLVVADMAGAKAQLIQTALASTVGYNVAKFEGGAFTKGFFLKNPLALPSQTVEEAIQNATGQLTSNVGIREFADEDQRLNEGVGESAVQGAVGGFGATNVITGPAIAKDLVMVGIKAGRDLTQHLSKVAAEEVRRKMDDKSAVGEKATSQRINDIDNIVSQAQEIEKRRADIQAAAEAGALSPEELQSFENAVAELGAIPVELADTTSEEFVSQTEAIKEDVVEGSRLKTLRKVYNKLAKDQYETTEQATAAAEFVIGEFDKLSSIVEQIENKDPETVTQTEKDVSELITGVMSNKVFSQGFDKGSAPVSQRELTTNPIGVDPARITPEMVAALPADVQRAAAVVQAIQGPKSREKLSPKSATNGKRPRNVRAGTRQELLFLDRSSKYNDIPSFNTLVSVAMRGAIKKLRGGDTVVHNNSQQQVDALDAFERLGNLVQHQLNKYEAGLQSSQIVENQPGVDAKVQYETLDPKTGTTFSSKEKGHAFYWNPKNENSNETFRQVIEDTNTGIRAYNALLKQFPEVFQGQAFELLPELPGRTQTNEESQQTEGQTTATEEVSAGVEDNSDTDVSGVQPGNDGALRPNELSFDTLFAGGSETTFADALKYLTGLTHLGPFQKQVLAVVLDSAFIKSNPKLKVRIGKKGEAQKDKTHGWWDPVAREIVVFQPSVSALLHEFIHAATLESLNQNLFVATNKDKTPRTREEKAAFELMRMANEFIDRQPANEKMASIQAMMRELITNPPDGNIETGHTMAINEFMAYGLTNRTVQNDLLDTPVPVREQPNLAQKIINWIKELLRVSPKETSLDRLLFNTHILASDYQAAILAAAQTEKVKSNANEPTAEPAAATGQEAQVQEQAQPEPVQETAPETKAEVIKARDAATAALSKAAKTQSSDDIQAAVAAHNAYVELIGGEKVEVQPAAVSEEAVDDGAALSEATPTQDTAPAVPAEKIVAEKVAPAETATPETQQQAVEPVGETLMVGADGKTTFHQAYKAKPILGVNDDVMDLVETSAEKLDYALTPELRETLQYILDEADDILDGLNKHLNTKLRERTWSKENSSFLDIMQALVNEDSDSTLMTSRPGMVLSLVDGSSLIDGDVQFDPHLMGLAILAALDYAINTENSGGIHKAEDIMDILGIKPSKRGERAIPITGNMYRVVNFGRSATDTKEAIARNIMDFWGASRKYDVSTTLTRGIAEGVADEIMDYLQTLAGDVKGDDNFWMAKQTIEVAETGRPYVSFRMGKAGQALGVAKTILRDVLTQPDADMHKYRLGEKFTNVSYSIAKDKNIPLPEDKRKAIQKKQDTPFKVSPAFFHIFSLAAKDGYNALYTILGYNWDADDNEVFFNDVDRQAIKGKNASIKSSIENLQDQLVRMQAYAEKNGVALEDIPVYYRVEVSLNGRFFMQGFNPQSNKLAREMLTPVSTKIDLTDQQQMIQLWAAIAQAYDEGDLKIENVGLKEAARRAQEGAKGKYREAIDVLKSTEELGDASIAILAEALSNKDIEKTPRLLKALYTIGQIEKAQAAGETEITTDLAVELDGKTNGPITAAIQTNLEKFTPGLLALFRRGGFFIGSRFDGQAKDMTYAEYHRTMNDTADLYEVVAHAMSGNVFKWRSALGKGLLTDGGKSKPNNIKNLARSQRLVLDLISELGEINFGPNENGEMQLSIKRKGTKSPITQNLYGAGGESISGGLANAIHKMIYAEITKAVRNNNGDRLKKLAAIYDELVDIRVGKDGKTQKLWAYPKPTAAARQLSAVINNHQGGRAAWMKRLQQFEFSSEQFERMSAAINHTYIPSFEEALKETVGETVKQTNDALVEATNAHANIYISMVRHAISEATKAKRESGELAANQDLSEKDYRAILAQHRRFAPIIDAGASIFDLTGGDTETTVEVAEQRKRAREAGEPEIATFNVRSETLNSTSSFSKRPSLADAGVKILPYNVIANADVKMVTGYYTDEKILHDTLDVHDGFEVPITRMKQASEVINASIAESWQLNTIEPVLQSLKSLYELEAEIRNAPIKIMSRMNGEEIPSISVIQHSIAKLEKMVDKRQAKIAALETVQFTVDGAPGAEAPFVKETGLRFNNENEMIAHLNRVREEKFAELQDARKTEQTKSLEESVEKEPQGGSELRKALVSAGFDGDPKTFVQILTDFVKNPDQKLVLREIVKSPAFQDAMDAGLRIEIQEQGKAPHYSAFDNILRISNVVPETALHELVHATTFHQLVEYFGNPEAQLSNNAKNAIKRMQSIAEDFLSRNFPANSVENNLQIDMRNHLNATESTESLNTAMALNEFMAWSLTNEQLISRGKKTLVSDAASQLRAIGRRVIEGMRRLLGFSSNKVFDHVLFNTTMILGSYMTSNAPQNTILRQKIYRNVTTSTQDSARKLELQNLIGKQITEFLSRRNAGDDVAVANAKQAQALAAHATAELESFNALSRVLNAGFDVDTDQDVLLFRSLQSIFSMDLRLDKVARLEAQKIFEKVSDKLRPQHFLTAMGTTLDNASQQQHQEAERMYRAVLGLPFVDANDDTKLIHPGMDAKGLSDRLSTFLALAQTSEMLRSVLSDMEFKDFNLKTELDTSSVDALLSSATTKALDRVNRRVGDDPLSQNATASAALDVLTEQLLSYEAEAATNVEIKTSSFFNRLNRKGKALLEDVGRQAGDTLQASAASQASEGTLIGDLSSIVLGIGAALSDIAVESRAEARADELTSVASNPKVPEFIRNLVAEMRGITNDTSKVFRLVKAAKQQISAMRQEFVEGVPKILANKFSDEFRNGTKGQSHKEVARRLAADWAHMFNGFGRTDLAVVSDTLGEAYSLNLFGNDPSKKKARQDALKEIKQNLRKKADLLGLSKEQTDRIMKAWEAKAKQLAQYQNDYTTGVNLLTSADAIVGLYNEDGLSISRGDMEALQKAIMSKYDYKGDPIANSGIRDLVRQIDVLTSLEAMDMLPDATHARLRELVTGETVGVKYALSYMKELRAMEEKKLPSWVGRLNGHKGYMSSTARRKYSVIVAPTSDEVELSLMGYTRMRDYHDPEHRFNGKRVLHSYFFSKHAKLANYNQGAMQTVQDTYFGVDPVTGQAVGPETTGEMITGDAMRLINRKIKEAKNKDFQDNYIPRFNSQGVLIGYERAVSPDMIQNLELSNNFAEALGRWAGRMQEEKAAYGMNMALMDALKEAYDKGRANGTDDQFAMFGREQDPKTGEWRLTKDLENDPIWKESYFLIPRSARLYGEQIFGGPIRIRRDMINNAVGFRSASVSDFYTGKNRLKDEVNKTMVDIFLATPFLGPKMYKYLTIGEETVQTVVSEAKHIIVVKSGVVLAANTLSNIIQLAGREVPLSFMGKRTKSKYAELAQYKKNEELKIRLRADAAAADSKSRAAAIRNRIETIEESERRMSIWPLIEANQFTTISEGLTDVDRALMDGKYMEWIEKKAAELPGPLSTIARYGIVSKDTALYQGMALAVQYSDFVAKAIYYDFLTEQRGVSPDEALSKIDAEFINYDLNDSRVRTYLESMGLTWFMNFKLRSVKIALDLLRNNPASVLISMMGAGVLGLDVGTPVTDNVASVAADGRLGYAVGPGMVEAGWNLNIWKQIFG